MYGVKKVTKKNVTNCLKLHFFEISLFIFFFMENINPLLEMHVLERLVGGKICKYCVKLDNSICFQSMILMALSRKYAFSRVDV